jgi:hypothetical protein
LSVPIANGEDQAMACAEPRHFAFADEASILRRPRFTSGSAVAILMAGKL